ncbi:MAG: NAD(P)/FAD-dependent oxidoreductase [Rhodospirillales bacterium]|nr:NAD(P)/FAD-dependent oxidoreductase [Rhodospirillales bacterium]
MVETVECIVVGAGAVGLAVARALALAGREVLVVEAAEGIGTGMSSRNSEVIHAGIYYPAGSLKAELCVRGKHLLYDYCREHGVPHKRIGKLIVATDDGQLGKLAGIRRAARANGVDDLEELGENRIRALEPAVHAVAGLLSPSTGIVDSHSLMLAYQGDAETAGAVLAFRSPVEGGRIENGHFVLEVGGADACTIGCRTLVNSAGLGAQGLATAITGIPPATVPPLYLAKGNYFTLGGRSPFTHLVYPIPEAAGLGVHVTLDLAGQARFGPDVEWIDGIDYDVDPRRADAFYAAIRAYWPDLKDGALQAGYSGIRPKLQAPGKPAADFVIQGPNAHGVKGLVNLYGIESPGLTASLAIAERVARELS